jgi:hypothetical protein
VFALLSTLWASDAQSAYDAAALAALYLGVFVLVALVASLDAVGRWLYGLAAGIAAVAVLSLVSRLFPSLGLGHAGEASLPAVVKRLSYPLGYWNGLAIFVALSVPCLLYAAVASRSAATRMVAVGIIPIVAADIYLASSRGGVLVATVGAVAFVLASGRGWEVSGALLAALGGSAIMLFALHSRPGLTGNHVTSSAAVAQGRSAALLVVVAVLVAAGLWFAIQALGNRWRAPPRAAGRAVVAAVVVLAALALVLAHPVARLRAFERPPLAPNAAGFTASHFLSGSGSGRWQFWTAALDEWRSAKLAGRGAGSFASWWAEHGSISMTTQNAHSIFFEALGELGLIGFLLVAVVWILGPALGLARTRSFQGEKRLAVAVPASAAAAFAAGAAVDWVWELPAVAVVGVTALALCLGDSRAPARARTVSRWGWAIVVVPLLVIILEIVPWTAALALGQSRDAASHGELDAATTAALRAHALEPWATAPSVQLALLDELQGRLGTAQAWIDEARRANGEDWQVRLIAARIETKRGAIAAAKRDLAAAERLTPRSPLFSLDR